MSHPHCNSFRHTVLLMYLSFMVLFSYYAILPTHFNANDIDNKFHDDDDYNNHTKMLLPSISNTDDRWWRRWLLATMTQQHHTTFSYRSTIVNFRAGHLSHTWFPPTPPWTLNTSKCTSTDTSSHHYYQSFFYFFLYFLFISFFCTTFCSYIL